MENNSNRILKFLSVAYGEIGFDPSDTIIKGLPANIDFLGGIEKKTFNQHRVVCVFNYPGSSFSFETMMIELKQILQRSFKAKFWRGLGVGLVIFSNKLIDDEMLTKSVYSADKPQTTIIQWIINIPKNSDSAKIAHTFSEVSTSFMINELLGHIGIDVEKRKVLMAEQVPFLKVKLV